MRSSAGGCCSRRLEGEPQDPGDLDCAAGPKAARFEAEHIEVAHSDVAEPRAPGEIIGEKGYHSDRTMVDLAAMGIRCTVAEADSGWRAGSEDPEAQAPGDGDALRVDDAAGH